MFSIAVVSYGKIPATPRVSSNRSICVKLHLYIIWYSMNSAHQFFSMKKRMLPLLNGLLNLLNLHWNFLVNHKMLKSLRNRCILYIDTASCIVLLQLYLHERIDSCIIKVRLVQQRRAVVMVAKRNLKLQKVLLLLSKRSCQSLRLHIYARPLGRYLFNAT